MANKKTPLERFNHKLILAGPMPHDASLGQCTSWDGFLYGGYPRLRVGDRMVQATRWIYEQRHGPIPEGCEVAHRCDTPCCTRDEHLVLMTHAENMADRNAKGRCPKWAGTRRANPNDHKAKLTEAQVIELRTIYSSGIVSQNELAEVYGIHPVQVNKIVTGRAWKHLLDRAA